MHWLLPELKGTKVLLYHQILPGVPDRVTVTPAQLEEQFDYLYRNGYRTIFVSELIKAIREEKHLPSRTIVLTFDDGYRNQVEFVEPLLKKFGFCACLFLIRERVMTGQGKGAKRNYLLTENIRKIDPVFFELGLYGFTDQPFAEMNEEKMKSDILVSLQFFSAMKIPIVPVLAHNHDARFPGKIKPVRAKRIMEECGIISAFGTGIGSVSYPVKDVFQLKRIEINGFDDLRRFRIKLRKGKLSPF